MRMRLRMYCAFGGICSFSASSTARTLAMAWTVVQTPQKRCVNSHASRGSRPSRMFSMPRHMVQLAHALATLPLSTSTSTRRWPSIRVTGSILILVAIATHLYVGINLLVIIFQVIPLLHRRRQNRQALDREQEQNDASRNEAKRDQNLDHRRRVVRQVPRPIGEGRRVEAIRHPTQHNEDAGREQVVVALAILLLPQEEHRQQDEQDLIPEQEAAEAR